MAAEQFVRVLGLGLDERFRSMLDVFFSRSCEGRYQLVGDEADMMVVDMDALGARDAYVEHRRSHTKVPSILFSLNEEQYKTRGSVVLLRKPFTVRQLQSAFQIVTLRYIDTPLGKRSVPLAKTEEPEKIAEERPRNQVDTADKQKSDSPAGASRAAFSLSRHDEYIKLNSLLPGMAGGKDKEQSYQSDHYLQSELRSAYEQASEAAKNAVITLGGGTVTIDPKQKLAAVGMGKFQLREVSSFPLNHNNFKINLVPAKDAPVEKGESANVLRLDELIWQTALYAAQGRVPEGADLQAPVQLRHWPNLTRLMLVEGAVRISAAWVLQAESIGRLASRLDLPVRDVSSFYSAAYALNLFHSEDLFDQVVEPKPEPNLRTESVLKRILNRLRA